MILILSVWICYAGVLKAPFVWDDLEMVVNNPLITSLHHVPDIFKTGAFLEAADSGKFYRPIQILTYTFDYAMGKGLNPAYFHLTSVVIHTLSVIALFFLLLEFGLNLTIAFWVTLFFAIHPLNTEAVTYVSGRGDVLFVLFCLVSFYAFLKGLKGSWGWFIGTLLGWVLAILSKENAVALPVIMASYGMWFPEKTTSKKRFVSSLVCLAVIGGYIYYRVAVSHVTESGTLSVIAMAPLWQRVLTIPHMIWLYLKLLVVPYPLHMEYHFVDTGMLNPYFLIGVPALLVGAFLVFHYVKPYSKVWFWGGWFFIGLGPVYQLLPLASTIREHWVYFPQIGLFVLLAFLGESMSQRVGFLRKKGVTLAILTCMAMVLMGLTWVRNQNWQNAFTLYSHDVEYAPNSFLLLNNLGYEYYFKGDVAAAKEAFKQSMEVAPGEGYGTAMNNYAAVIEGEGRTDEAIELYKKSISVSHYQLAYANLGKIYLLRNQFFESIHILKEGLLSYPYHLDMNYYLAIALMQAQQTEESKKVILFIQSLHPHYKNTDDLLLAIERKRPLLLHP